MTQRLLLLGAACLSACTTFAMLASGAAAGSYSGPYNFTSAISSMPSFPWQFPSPPPVMCDDTHQVGDHFASDDGCNTCVCTTHGTICTMRACMTPPPPPTTDQTSVKCYSSNDCSATQYCTTEDGDCHADCPPGQMCSQVCSGICKDQPTDQSSSSANSCDPIVCSDGSSHPSCSADGHPIYYFADPCQFSHRPVCGNAICESGEANQVDPGGCGPNADPRCLGLPARLIPGSCPSDCQQ